MFLNDSFNKEKLPIERVFLSKGERISWEPFECELWMLRKGVLRLIKEKEEKNSIHLGQLFLLPPGHVCTLEIQQNIQSIRMFIPDCVALCEKFFFPGIIEEKTFFHSSFNPVEMVPLLWEYMNHLDVLFEECPLTSSFIRVKIEEFFIC
ncbi:MAG: hypothetical protein LUG51_09245 [Tannerellaceae bacterium]|nr:hypothetical protein [Tannerellaceae bacterium]